MLLFNALLVIKANRFFPFLLFFGCALTCAALFGVAVGEPEDAYGYRPTWFKVGVAVSAIVGLVVALVLNIELSFP